MKRTGFVFSLLSLIFTAIGAAFYSYLLIRAGIASESTISIAKDGSYVLGNPKPGWTTYGCIAASALLMLAVGFAAFLLLKNKSVILPVVLSVMVFCDALVTSQFTMLSEFMFVRYVFGASRVIPVRLFSPAAAVIFGAVAIWIEMRERKKTEEEK